MNRSARGWSVKRFERSNRLDTALYKNIPLHFFYNREGGTGRAIWDDVRGRKWISRETGKEDRESPTWGRRTVNRIIVRVDRGRNVTERDLVRVSCSVANVRERHVASRNTHICRQSIDIMIVCMYVCILYSHKKHIQLTPLCKWERTQKRKVSIK